MVIKLNYTKKGIQINSFAEYEELKLKRKLIKVLPELIMMIQNHTNKIIVNTVITGSEPFFEYYINRIYCKKESFESFTDWLILDLSRRFIIDLRGVHHNQYKNNCYGEGIGRDESELLSADFFNNNNTLGVRIRLIFYLDDQKIKIIQNSLLMT